MGLWLILEIMKLQRNMMHLGQYQAGLHRYGYRGGKKRGRAMHEAGADQNDV
jgi:hypothetical protein